MALLICSLMSQYVIAPLFGDIRYDSSSVSIKCRDILRGRMIEGECSKPEYGLIAADHDHDVTKISSVFFQPIPVFSS